MIVLFSQIKTKSSKQKYTIVEKKNMNRQHVEGRCICQLCNLSFGDDFDAWLKHRNKEHADRVKKNPTPL